MPDVGGRVPIQRLFSYPFHVTTRNCPCVKFRDATPDRSKSRKSRKGFTYCYLGSLYVANNLVHESPNLSFAFKYIIINTGMLKCRYYSDIQKQFFQIEKNQQLGNLKTVQQTCGISIHLIIRFWNCHYR